MYGKLKGYKTFIVAGLAILAALLGFLDGDLSKQQAGQLILNAALGITLRDALNTSIGRAIEHALIAAALAGPRAPLTPVRVQTVAPPQPPVPEHSAMPLNDAAAAIAPVAVDVLQAVKAIIAASEKPAA